MFQRREMRHEGLEMGKGKLYFKELLEVQYVWTVEFEMEDA